jgi:hypothetical protein
MLSDKYLWLVPELTLVHKAYKLASFQELVPVMVTYTSMIVVWLWLNVVYLFVRFCTYLRGLNLAQKRQVESPINTSDSPILLQQGLLDALREQTLATQSYLSQHWLSFTLYLADQGHMPESTHQDYHFCQYLNPALAHNNSPCDCLTTTNGTK